MVALAEISCAEGKVKRLCGRRVRCVKNCGYRYDAETDNYYLRNRYHSPVLGRWLTRDPIGYQGGINLYGYVSGRPTAGLDPSGLSVLSPGYPLPNDQPPPPVLSEGAAQALLDLIASLVDFAWLPEVAAVLAGLLLALAAWKVTCNALHDSYKLACQNADRLGGCRSQQPCSYYPPGIAARSACASGRQLYIDAGCDIANPTNANHRAAAADARAVLAKCINRQRGCKPDCLASLSRGGVA
jgi:RHS repeat-associated protein